MISWMNTGVLAEFATPFLLSNTAGAMVQTDALGMALLFVAVFVGCGFAIISATITSAIALAVKPIREQRKLYIFLMWLGLFVISFVGFFVYSIIIEDFWN